MYPPYARAETLMYEWDMIQTFTGSKEHEDQ